MTDNVEAFIQDNMSLELVNDYLRSKEEKIDNFEQKLLYSSAKNGESALEKLANKAISIGCEYVAHVYSLSQVPPHAVTKEEHQGGGSYKNVNIKKPGSVTLVGTGLVPK